MGDFASFFVLFLGFLTMMMSIWMVLMLVKEVLS